MNHDLLFKASFSSSLQQHAILRKFWKSEIGSVAGYSGIWLARALPTNGHLIILKINPQLAKVVSNSFAKAGSNEKGGKSESVNVLAQYLRLRKETHESELHFFVGSALRDLLKYRQFPGLIGVQTEEPFIPGRTDPVPDITIRNDEDNYALEFHFMRKQSPLARSLDTPLKMS